MNGMLIVAQKEIRQILKSRNVLASAIIFVIVFGGFSSLSTLTSEGGGGPLDQLVFTLVPVLGIFMGYLFSSQAFLREKQGGIVETLLCSPLSLREIWMGKVIGVTVPAYGLTLLAAALILGLANSLSQMTLLPSLPLIAHLFTTVPLFIAATVGLLGFAQLLLGLRENQILNFAIIFALIFLLTMSQALFGSGFTISWVVVGSSLAIAILLLIATSWLTRFLDKERIVITIP
ncbi:MAG: ABC transporter permease [Methanomicrobiales archaeon]|nr:ABC transporter permease [Methanomicrobiales archaeon]